VFLLLLKDIEMCFVEHKFSQRSDILIPRSIHAGLLISKIFVFMSKKKKTSIHQSMGEL